MKHVNGTSQIILGDPGKFYGWPGLTCTPEGGLIAVVSGNRLGHVCPFGQTLLVRSGDRGKRWSRPQVIVNTPLDDRDPGILATRDGTLVVTWFTSLAYEHVDPRSELGPGFVRKWNRKVRSITDADKKRWLGNWSIRSTDGGHTWEDPVSTIVTAPAGGIELSDGRLLMIGNAVLDGNEVVAASESKDKGRNWSVISVLRVQKDPQKVYFCEPHLAETTQGRLVAHFRYDTWNNFDEDIAWQSESDDGGHTWAELHPTPIHGHPQHLLRLRNGWLLDTHGYRHVPFGQRACISRDGGQTWDVENELVIRDDGPQSDLGYPATAQLPDDSLYTVYYQSTRRNPLCTLMGTHWRLEE